MEVEISSFFGGAIGGGAIGDASVDKAYFTVPNRICMFGKYFPRPCGFALDSLTAENLAKLLTTGVEPCQKILATSREWSVVSGA